MAKTLSQTVQNFTNSAGVAAGDWLAGIESTTVDPTSLAAQNGNAAVSNYSQAISSGRWAAALQRAGKAGWLAGSRAKQANYSNGIAQAGPKYQAAMQTWLPIIDNAAAQVRSMPSGSLAASQARAATFMQLLYNAKRGL